MDRRIKTSLLHPAHRGKQVISFQDLIKDIDIAFDARRLAAANPLLSLVTLKPPHLRNVLVPWFERGGIPVIQNTQQVDRQRFPQELR
jgi:hypothetical protein